MFSFSLSEYRVLSALSYYNRSTPETGKACKTANVISHSVEARHLRLGSAESEPSALAADIAPLMWEGGAHQWTPTSRPEHRPAPQH